MDYYELFCLWCSSIGKKPATVAKNVGLTKGAPTNWKNRHSAPPIASQIAIASYFGVSLDDFKIGPNKEKPTTPEDDGLTATQAAAMEFIKTLSGEQLKRFIAMGKAAFDGEAGQ